MKRHVFLFLLCCLTLSVATAQTLTVTPTVNNVTCNNANNGSATIAVSGCAGTPTYVWTPNVSTTNSASNLAPGSYTVDVTTPATSGSDTLFYDNFNTTTNWVLNNTIGTQGGTANAWIINSASTSSGTCAGTAGGNTMHVTCGGGFICNILAPNGEAVYNAGGAANVTDKFCPLVNSISTIGRTNVQVKFLYRCNGEGSNDYGSLRYSIDGGTNWTDLPTIYSATSAWTCETVTLPVACENIATLKIAFRWRNNGNNAGADPPMNLDNVLIRADGGSGGSGCTGTTTFTITQPTTALSVNNSSQTNVACFNGTTGAVTLAGAGGTGAYQYKIGNGAYQSSPTFSGLTAGTYTFTVQDANLCTSTVNATITQPTTALSVSITNQTAATCGGSNGTVTVAGAGGTVGGGYQYKIGNGSYQSGTIFGGLSGGTYTVTVQDANLCTSTVQVTITQPSNLSVSASGQTNVLCFNGTTGSATVAGAGGTPGYLYKIGNGSYQNSGTFSGLAAGVYTITVQDAGTCTSTTTVTITQPSTAVSVSNSNQTNVLCNSASTGSVTVAGGGGTGAYQYKIGSGAYQSSPTFSGLAAGTYTITVQDANLCTSTLSVTITQPTTALSVSNSTQTNILCNNGSTGSVTVAGAGGTGAYQYKIGNGAYQSSPTFSGLSVGTYTITVQDANLCTSTINVVISQPNTAVSGSITAQTNVACGGNTGAVTVAGAGGTGAFQYKIGNGSYQNSGTFTGLAAGTYTVTVQDANLCTSTVSVTITQPVNALSVSNSNQTNVLCFNSATGSVTVAGAGGAGSYQYKIGNGPLQNSGTFTGLGAGTYVITVQDINSCTSTVSVTITQPAVALTGSIVTQTSASCSGGLGDVSVTGIGGTGAYQYKLDNGTYQNSGAFTGLNAASYVITVQDANGCTTTIPVTIGSISNVLATVGTITPATCNGFTDGGVVINGSGGSGALNYSINNGTTFGSSNSFTGLGGGNYSVIVKDNSGCADTVSFNVTEPAPFVPTTNVTGSVSICDGDSILLSVTSPNSTACSWSTTETGSIIYVGQAGTVTVNCTDNNGCQGTSADIIIGTTPLPVAAFGYSQVDNYNIQFDNQSVNGTTYQWEFPGSVLDTTTDAIFNFPQEGTYTVTLTATNDCGNDTSTVTVTVVKLTSVNENSILSSFNLFPNPTNGTTTLQMNAIKPVKGTLSIITPMGQLVHTENVSFNTAYTKTIDLTKLAAGIYIISLNTDNVNVSRKLIIEK